MTRPDVNMLDALPHRPPFRFLTEVRSLRAAQSGEAVWHVSGREPLLKGHFPGRPIVPGVLIAEALAQLSGLVGLGDPSRPQASEVAMGDRGRGAVESGGQAAATLAHIDVRFKKAVKPPVDVVLTSRVQRTVGALIQFAVEARVSDTRVAFGTLTLSRDPSGRGERT